MTDFFNDNYDVILQLNFSEDVCFDDRENETDKRICRFCGNIESEKITFKKEAHAVSNCLGNKSILTENECDSCNSNFGKTIENELGNYFKHFKPLLRITGKKGHAKFVQQGKKETEISIDEDLVLEVKTNNDEHVELDLENKKVKFKLKSSAYSPFAVYQSFMKIFFSVLPKEYVKEADFIKLILNYDGLERYTEFLEGIQNLDLLRKYILDNAKAIKLFIPGAPLSDLIILRKKDSVTIGGPKFLFIIRVANFAYQFAIPTMIGSKSATVPSIFDKFLEMLPNEILVKTTHEIEDFGSLEKISPVKVLGFSCDEIRELRTEEINKLQND